MNNTVPPRQLKNTDEYIANKIYFFSYGLFYENINLDFDINESSLVRLFSNELNVDIASCVSSLRVYIERVGVCVGWSEVKIELFSFSIKCLQIYFWC